MGRYKEFVDNFREMVDEVLPKMEDRYMLSERLCWLAYGEGMRCMFSDAQTHFNEAFAIRRDMGLADRKDFQGPFQGFWGAICTKQGEFALAEQHLGEALKIKQEVQDTLGIPEVLIWLGELYEMRQSWELAQNSYRQCLQDYQIGRPYFDSTALTGLVRVCYRQAQYEHIESLFSRAQTLAQENEYNDHLASLHLIAGHLAWKGQMPSSDSGFEAAERWYQQALIYALRYNRFLLDEVLQGKIHTALPALIPHCLAQGEQGHQMLAALCQWWQKSTNDTGISRPDSISLIQEGIPLLDAEARARELEPDYGTPQRRVIEQLQYM